MATADRGSARRDRMSDYVLALDAGGTATTCWLVQRDGSVVGSGHGGPGNHVLGAWETVRASFRDAIDGALLTRGGETHGVSAVVAGCAGIEATGETRGPIEQLLGDLLPAVPVRRAVGDMVVAFHGALPEGVGVVVIAGTGAVAYGQNAAGDAAQADGWGHLFGDAGSGYALGRAALRAAAAAMDGRGPSTILMERLPEALGVPHLPAAAYQLYADPAQRESVAALARPTIAAAEAGDTVARELVRAAGAALGRTAGAVLARLDMAGTAAPVATAGSLFRAGGILLDPFTDALATAAPAARVTPAALPPVGGAAKLAWEAGGVAWGADEVARARVTQPS